MDDGGLTYWAERDNNLGRSAGSSGQLFTVDLLVSASQEVNVKAAFAVGDYWRRAGVTPNNVVEPTQLAGPQRREYEATRPAFFLTRSGSDVDGFPGLLSSQIPLPENDFVGSNASRYRNPEFDAACWTARRNTWVCRTR